MRARLVLLLLLAWPLGGSVKVLFEGTDLRLEVITVRGPRPGPTVLVFGGIHGDEPGGYFSSELLARIRLRRGNLIVVPRVNLPSVMLNRRQVYGDMNRMFTPSPDPRAPQRRVVEELKKLMAQADVFINQHDAWGFHRERWESPRRNPGMYGQSLIVDTDRFHCPRLGREVDLDGCGRRIVARVNRLIPDPATHFGFWNHHSVRVGTRFPEMRKSATHYALSNFAIPAFGLETSKDLPSLAMKVQHQLLVIGEILREFGLEFDLPPVDNLHPELHWIELLKNGSERIRVNGGTNLRLDPGDRVTLNAIAGSDAAGWSADVPGWGQIDDIGREYGFGGDAEIVVRKNNLVVGRVHLRHLRPDSLRRIRLDVDGRPQAISNWGVLSISPGARFRVLGGEPACGSLRVDVRGFPAPRPGGDDAGVEIRAAGLQPAFSFQGAGRVYFVRLTCRGRLWGGFQLEVGAAQ